MHWLSLLLTKIFSEGFPTSFNFSRGSSLHTMITVLIKAYCVKIVVDVKPIYLNKRYWFQNKINYLDKTYFCFAKTKLFKHTFKKETLAQVFSCGFCEIFKNTFYRTPLGDYFWTSNSVPQQCLQMAKSLISSCKRTVETICSNHWQNPNTTAAVHYFRYNSHRHYHYHHFHYHWKMHFYRLKVLLIVFFFVIWCPICFNLSFLYRHVFFYRLFPSFSLFTPSKRTQN